MSCAEKEMKSGLKFVTLMKLAPQRLTGDYRRMGDDEIREINVESILILWNFKKKNLIKRTRRIFAGFVA
jgi:hypothetical protein